MIQAFIYVYPHPHEPGKYLYVGQENKEGKRDKDHRAGRTSFSRRFKRDFPGVDLPRPIRRQVSAPDSLTLNEEETIDMFRYHTWRGYLGGMNLIFPGSIDYEHLGRTYGHIGGHIAVERGHIQALGRSGVGGRIGGPIQGRKHAENKTGVCGRTPEQISEHAYMGGCISGRKAVESGQIQALGRSGITNCLRWNIRRGKSCVCGKHSQHQEQKAA